ncbi:MULTISPECIES: YlmC/YmxH family sporulation protein [Caproicibacterium]|uniref:YlmC/YmxH family sporulation protein n=1 Tax=Caproicibacterium argilliputei TaxID=3030016 RepID=A0AA97D942_9FIRM|nr:YlmC/YmxH family sporulation protein [Caproicibacterium argilliputei]WOC31574.1 YlmC/YmxH family sporulation protein [Caproicibacterium argilliputei]
MHSRVYDMHRKEVINIRDGTRIGNVGDIEIDTITASVLSLVIYGRLRFFGLLGREDDRIIPWSDIRVIGEDIILVDTQHIPQDNRRWLSRATDVPPTPEHTPPARETGPKK